MYTDRICPVCGLTFTPNTKNQIYDKAQCRVKAYRQRQRNQEPPLDATGLLDEIRKVDAETAHDIEEIARKAGLQFAEQILFVCWRAMNRAAIRHAKTVLLESGEVKEKRKPVRRKK